MASDLRGKTVLVTGASRGIGLEAAAALAGLGARVLMVGRDAERTEAAAAEVKARSGLADVIALICDFGSQADIRRLAADVLARADRLHVLVNNAGGVNKARRVTVDGIEATFAVNHLGYFLLTAELARRLAGTGVTSNSIHPGSVATSIWSGAPLWAKPIIHLFFRPSFISPRDGAAGVVKLAADPALAAVTGAYFEEGRAVPPAALARDEALARRLWEVSARLVGLDPVGTR
jgi:NAD(P)-dependent dehydrogenase (short-subunit alcohol dehydrogenase family)